MTDQDGINQILIHRLAWVENKIVEVLRLIITGFSFWVGWIVANATIGDQDGWLWRCAVFSVTVLLVFPIVWRIIFKGAPRHIDP